MPLAHFITHPEVVIDPAIPVPDWSLSPRGLARMRAALDEPWVAGVGAVFASTERKAREAAAVLAVLQLKKNTRSRQPDAIGVTVGTAKGQLHRSIDAGRATRRGVTLGLRGTGVVEVAAGLKGGEAVIPLEAPVVPGDKVDRKSTRLNSSHLKLSRMPSSA